MGNAAARGRSREQSGRYSRGQKASDKVGKGNPSGTCGASRAFFVMCLPKNWQLTVLGHGTLDTNVVYSCILTPICGPLLLGLIDFTSALCSVNSLLHMYSLRKSQIRIPHFSVAEKCSHPYICTNPGLSAKVD